MFTKKKKKEQLDNEQRLCNIRDIKTISTDMDYCIDITPVIVKTPHIPENSTSSYDNKFIIDKLEKSDNSYRKQLLWTDKIEDVINSWYLKCLENADNHLVKAKRHKCMFYSLNIPAAIIPMTIAALTETTRERWELLITFLLIVNGILNIVNGFLNSGKKAENHMNFNALYNELAVNITSEIVKPKKFRQSADVFIQRIMDNYNSLNNRAPE